MKPAGDYRNPQRREHFVYRAFDLHGRLLYVGCTMRLAERWAEHRAWSRWASRARRFRISGPYNYDTARRLEREAVRSEHPRFNWHVPGRPRRRRVLGRRAVA